MSAEFKTRFSFQLLQKRGPHQALAAIGSPTAQLGEMVISLVNSSVLPKPIGVSQDYFIVHMQHGAIAGALDGG